MRTWISGWRSLGLSLMVLLMASNAHALSAEAVKGMSIGDTDARVEALGKALTDAADERTAAFIQALSDDAVKVAGEQVLVVRDGAGTDPMTGQAVPVPDTQSMSIGSEWVWCPVRASVKLMPLSSIMVWSGDPPRIEMSACTPLPLRSRMSIEGLRRRASSSVWNGAAASVPRSKTGVCD